MSTAAERAPRSLGDLRPADRARLEAAHQRLRDAIQSYEHFLGHELSADEEVPVHDVHEVAKAQREVEHAEDELWRARSELLGWSRPAWAPRASLIADWFSDEDRIYDDA